MTLFLYLTHFPQGQSLERFISSALDDVMSQPSLFSMQHDLSMVELMKLYRVRFRGYLIGIEISEIGFGHELSAVLRDKLPQICGEVETAIQKILWEETIYA